VDDGRLLTFLKEVVEYLWGTRLLNLIPALPCSMLAELRKIAKPSSQETLSGEPEELPFEGLQMRRVFLVLLIPFLAPVILIAWFLGNF